jgi:anaerobic ribonucleoside-triphosphate reductase activating protein
MRYHNITKDDMLNGDGLRVVLWIAGCSHHCKGCQNPMTWDPQGGIAFTQKDKEEVFGQLDKSYIEGITFSGGDPLYEGNREDITSLAKEIHERYPEKTIWLYTGYLWEDVKKLEIVKYLDVLVDGKFDLASRDVSLKWKGSPNQRVIDVPKSLSLGLVVLHA